MAPVVFVIGRFFPMQGGTASAGYASCQALIALGWRVVIIRLSGDEHGNIVELASDFQYLRQAVTHQIKVNARILESPSEYLLFRREILSIIQHSPAVVYSNYMTSYAELGDKLAYDLNIPHVMSHAGSDYFALTDSNANTLKNCVIPRAAAVITNFECAAVFEQFIVQKDRIWRNVIPYNLWQQKQSAKDADLFWCLAREVIEIHSERLPPDAHIMLQSYKARSQDCLTLAVYGKFDRNERGAKNHNAILNTVRCLVDSGKSVQLHTLTDWEGLESLQQKISLLGLKNHCFCLPFVGPWHISSFLAAADAAFFLENNFWLQEHRSQEPLEIMSYGTCGIFSGPVALRLELAGLGNAGSTFLAADEANPITLFSLLKDLEKATALKIGENAAKAISPLKNRLWNHSLRLHHVLEQVATCKPYT